MAVNDVAWQEEGCIMHEIFLMSHKYLGHNFISGLRTLKRKNVKT